MGKRKDCYKKKTKTPPRNRHVLARLPLDASNSTVENVPDQCRRPAKRKRGEEEASSAPLHLCASSAKLRKLDTNKEESVPFDSQDELTGFRFVDCELLVTFINGLLCPECKRPIGAARLSSVTEVRTDLASELKFECGCQHNMTLFTSKKCNKVFEVNRRFPLSMFVIGRDQAPAKRFLGNMNIPCSLNNSTWANHKNQIRKATEKVADISKSVAAHEVSEACEGNDVTVSGDGTYHRRGFQSKNGVVTVLSVNGKKSKVVDTEVLSNHCDSCKKQEKKKQGQELLDWKDEHRQRNVCDKNHEGSAAAMEPAGALKIFRRSQELHGLRYVNFLGDGDSKTYSCLKNSEPPVYEGVRIEKLECCGHVQKRMGRQLLNKVNELKNKTFNKNGKSVKGIGGKGGGLTKKAILKIQAHFGAAIRKNSGNLGQMKKDIWAIWQHRNKKHDNCGTWCPSKTGRGDPDKNAFPDFVCEAIRPIFVTLTQDSLLERCLHGGSQNTNESFHNLIWQRCPKTVFVGRKRLCLAVADATIVYNDGECGRLDIFPLLGMEAGTWTRQFLKKVDASRVSAGQIQASEAVQFARRLRSLHAAEQNVDGEEYYLSGAHE